MKYQGCLLAVKDISASKSFYETVLHQNAVMNIGEHVAFEGFSLQQGYAEIVGMASDSVKEQSHNFQVYFEVEDLDQVYAELKRILSLQWVHEIREYPWGQRDTRLPLFLSYPMKRRFIACAPLLEAIDLTPYLQTGRAKALGIDISDGKRLF